MIKTETTKRLLRSEALLAWVFLLALCLFCGARYAENILIIQAYGGWSPMDWVAHQLMPDNFKADFPNGISVYRMSSFMQVYFLAAAVGLNLESLTPWLIYFEIAFLGFSAAVMFRALAPGYPYAAMAVFALLIIEGSARNMELARFGGAFYQGLYYNIADGLRLLGLCLLFRGRIVWSAVLLALSFTVHPVMAGMACIFAVPYLLATRSRFSVRRWLLAAATFALIAAVWLGFKLQAAEVASGGINSDNWLALVRMFSYHWFPVDIGVFTRWHERYVFPLLCLVSMAFVYLPRVVSGSVERRSIAWGMGILAYLTVAGILISELSSEPFLIKLALHRASDMLIVVSLAIVVAGLVQSVMSRAPVEAALGAALLLSPLVSQPAAFPLLPTMLLLGWHARNARLQSNTSDFAVALLAIGVLTAVVLGYWISGMTQSGAHIGTALMWTILASFSAAGVLALLAEKSGVKRPVVHFFLSVALLIIVSAACVARIEAKSAMRADHKNMAIDYLETQRWARRNTTTDSVFMIDPAMSYGWRDFSQRSSFGSLREWLHTGWLYDSRKAVYERGMERFSEFGISLEPYLQIRPSIEGYHRLSDDLGRAFYQKDRGWFDDMSRRYALDYLVLQKKFVTRDYGLTKVFENASFVVYRLK